MTNYPWKYHCGFCDVLVDVEDIALHIEADRLKDDWPGTTTLSRVDQGQGEPAPAHTGRPTVGFYRP